jgi:hypothetical protein
MASSVAMNEDAPDESDRRLPCEYDFNPIIRRVLFLQKF